MIRLALKHDIRTIEAFDRFVVRVAPDGSRALLDYEPPDVPQIAIPTTLSGGDFNPSAGATDTRTMLKEIYRHPRLVPSVIILDPAVTVRTPQWLWLSSGIRALDHAVETVCAPSADARSLAGGDAGDFVARARRCRERIRTPTIWAPGWTRNSRSGCRWSTIVSAFSMGASHGIGHVLGGTCDVPHGYTSCVMLPAVLRYNESANAERQALVSEAFGRARRTGLARGG